MRNIVSKILRVGLDAVFGKPEPFDYQRSTSPRCPNCLREL